MVNLVKQLKKFNGRAICLRNPNDSRWDGIRTNQSVCAYIGAYSVTDAIKLIEEYCGTKPSRTEISSYWNKGAWGIHMDGVELERGIWIQFDHTQKPVRVL